MNHARFQTLAARDPKKVTYEHLLQGILEKEAPKENPWDYHVDVARKLLKEAYFNRMAVAEVAIRASLLRGPGGDRHSKQFKEESNLLSLRAFAEAVGLLPSTLYLWVSIKTTVFDRLPSPERDVFQHDAGEKAARRLGKKSQHSAEVVHQVYQRFANQTKEQKALGRLFKYIQSIKKYLLATEFWRHLTDDQLDMLRMSMATILKRIIEIQELKRGAPKRKSRAKAQKEVTQRG